MGLRGDYELRPTGGRGPALRVPVSHRLRVESTEQKGHRCGFRFFSGGRSYSASPASPVWLHAEHSWLRMPECAIAVSTPALWCLIDGIRVCLVNGVYVMYVSDAVKEQLRPYVGTAMQVNATDVIQPMNPGDGLIERYELIGPAPHVRGDVDTRRVEIHVDSDFAVNSPPAFMVRATNTGTARFEIAKSNVGLLLLGSNKGIPFSPSDGKSVAWITRVGVLAESDRQSGDGWRSTIDGSWITSQYSIDRSCAPPDTIALDPGRSIQCRVSFYLPPGHYQFMLGYGGGVFSSSSIVSNAISFGVTDQGTAVLE